MELRRSFPDGDLNYLANLCHSCGACYEDCQFSPPHEFDVNVPAVLAQVRAQSYESYVWPRFFSGVFARNGVIISAILAVSVAVFILGFVAWHDVNALFATHTGPGSFYRFMPHAAMAWIFGLAFLYALIAMFMGARNFWRDIGEPASTLVESPSLWQAMKDAGTLRYLDGGKAGCYTNEEGAPDHRRLYHHLTFYGFMLCFAATCIATFYHYALGRIAPYPVYDLPVIFGTLGGIGLLIGPVGLYKQKLRDDPAVQYSSASGMDTAFLGMLFLTSLTGLALLILRATPLMGILLAVHLGVVFALFITMPYGKFVHGIYRFMALVRYARERRLITLDHPH